MNTSLAYLPPAQRQELEVAKGIIIEAVRPEKIILFGIFSVEAEARLYSEGLPPGIGAYDLLVVTTQGDRRSDYELQDIIENRCRGVAPVTVLVHDIGYVNRKIAEGQNFFATVLRSAILLYDAGRTPLAKAGPTDPAQVLLVAERDFDLWRRQSQAFFKSAVFNLGIGEWKIVVFMLHQAAEQMYQAI